MNSTVARETYQRNPSAIKTTQIATNSSPMSEFHHNLLFPELELLEPPPLFRPHFPSALRPFCRGPMYCTYAKLRDSMRRLKKARHSPSTPIMLPGKRSEIPRSVDRSFSLSKENKKPPMKFSTFMTPPKHIAYKPELRKSVTVSVGKLEEKKRCPDAPFNVRRSFSVLNEFKEEGKGGRGGNKGILRNSVIGLERSKLMKAIG